MPVEIPLIIKKIPPKGRHVFVEGRINGYPLRFLIDTGASKSVIDSAFVQAYFPKKKIINTTHQTTGLGTNIPNSNFVRMHRVRIGDKKIGAVQFALLDLHVINDAYTLTGLPQVSAIIGADILVKNKCSIDFNTEKINFPLQD
jgi:hypothetical protein